jgi:hypothetical protein
MPTFTFEPITATSYRVRDAHTGELYGTIARTVTVAGWGYRHSSGRLTWAGLTRDAAATALYRARYAHGFEAGAL